MVIESIDLVTDVGIAFVVGVGLFLVIFIDVICRRHIRGESELPNVRVFIKFHRVICGSFIALLGPLFWEAAADNHPVISPITSYGNGSSWNFGWGRPVIHFAFVFFGFSLDFHALARLSCVLGMAQAMVLDTLSSYDLGTQIECVKSGRCALPENTSLWDLKLLNARDLTSVALGTCALLLVGYLSLVIGICRVRFSFRQLQGGDRNRVYAMRKELAKRGTAALHYKHDDTSA